MPNPVTELSRVLTQALREGWALVCLDGALIATTRSSAPLEGGHDLWNSGKHKQHGGNVQPLIDPTEFPVWVLLAEAASRCRAPESIGSSTP
jgi:hypothetical protein